MPERYVVFLGGCRESEVVDLAGGVDAALFVERRGEFDLGSVGAFDGFRAALNLAIEAPNGPKSLILV
jgi:hypothetical protein